MKLQEGAYENIITKELQGDISQAENNGLVCKQEDIDNSEAPSMLAEHINKLVINRLSDESLTAEERKDFVNSLIEFIGAGNEEKVVDEKMLSAVVSKQEEVRLKVTKQDIIRPLTGFRISNLFTGGHSNVPLNVEIERDIESADRISLIVSFLKLSGVNLIYDKLKNFCNQPNHKLRIITTTYCGVTEAKAVERLANLPNTEIRISYNTTIERLHAKTYIFERNSGFSTAYIGSSNLSKSAQTDGLEWNIRVTNVENPHIIKTALATFNLYWNSQNFENFKDGGLQKLHTELAAQHQPRQIQLGALQKYSILPHQKKILDRLTAVREGGIKRNLIVAATGTGKTVISAFDYKLFSEDNPHHKRILFVAHRQEILVQSLNTYRSVLCNANFGELWVGQNQPKNSIDNLFISVQTFNSKFKEVFCKLPSDYYDYIVIDEAHHLVADSYRKILTHFSPKLLIGLTATPERMDGASLLPDFDNKISAEIRLPIALNEGLLTPFQYLCISDNTDLSDDELMQGNKYVATKLTEKLCNKERVGLIIQKLKYYLADENKCKALGFCSTIEHARFMAESFEENGLKADYLTANKNDKRDYLNKKLAKCEINYLFVVDIFNEGVDIPEIDTVLFLRPTESLTIFLQQLGRGLRLAPGKQLLTVFDFVAQLNKKYDFTSRFRSLMVHKDKSVVEQVKNGFTLLPHGCTIHMEEKAQQYVLENIKAAIYNKKRLIQELRTYDHTPTLKEFIDNNGQDIRLIYKGDTCWSSLKREAGLCSYPDDANTCRFQKSISNLVHANSISYLHFIQKTISNLENISFADEREKTYSIMLYYTLYGDRISKIGVSSIEEAIGNLKSYPIFINEIQELSEYLLTNIENKTYAVGEGMPLALEQYGYYTREEVFAIFGRQTADKKMQGSVAGVFNIEELNTELFFVTLNKSEKDFSPSTMYDDYVVSENQFHWKSQNTDSHKGKGKRFVEQAINKKKFVLFVREYKKDSFGNTCPFYCFGLVDYISSCDDKPMSIDWHMHQPILPQFIKAV
jgi:superfamily II DNA or RNA helicase